MALPGEYIQKLDDFFQMKPLEGLDPGNPAHIPHLIIGAFIANQRGMAEADVYLREMYAGRPTSLTAGKALAESKASINFTKIAELVGETALSVTATSTGSSAILEKGFHPVPSAVGDLNWRRMKGVYSHALGGHTGGRQDLMRLTGRTSGSYFFVKVIDESYDALVDIEVVRATTPLPRRLVRRLFGWQ